MKIQNIFKIGVLSVVLLSLLISPVLRFNNQQLYAQDKPEPPDDQIAEYCEKLPEYTSLIGQEEKTEWCNRCCVLTDKEDLLLESKYNWKDSNKQQGLNNLCDSICKGIVAIIWPHTEPDEDTTIGQTIGAAADSISKIHEKPAQKICKDGGFKSTLDAWQPGWIEYQLCVFQKGIVEGTGKLVSGLMNSLISLILWAFDPATYGGFVENDSVKAIWGALRDFMNLALVLILVFIAIATILGIKKYRWQETLWKLVIVALLINFSLIIPGVILDVSHFVTFTFLNSAKLDNDNIATSMMTVYRTEEISGEEKYKLTLVDDATQDSVEGWAYSWGNFFLTMAAIIILGLFAVISLLAIFVTMIFRSFIIIALLCVAPVAFAAWILPNTAQFWQLWWNQFIKWCTFPITFALMLYIGLFILNSVNQVNLSQAGDKANIVSMFIQIILFSMFLVGGLIFSVQSGGAVAQTVQKQGSKLALGAGALIGKKTIHGVQGTKVYRDVGQQLTHVPVVSKIGFDMLDKSDQARITTDIRKREKEMENRGKEEIRDIANSATPSRLNKGAYIDHMAARNIAIKKGWLKNDDNALTEIRKDIQKDNLDLDAVAIRNAFPQYFRIGKDGKLEELNTEDRNYTKQVVNNLRNISADKMPKDTENIVKAVQDADKDVGELFQELISLKTNQVRAFFDNVSEKEYTQGELFGGSADKPKPWTGRDGEISKTLRTRLSQAQARADDATKLSLYDSQGYEDPNVKLEQEDSKQELEKIKNAIETLEGKLKSPTLKETMGTEKIK